MIQIIVSKPTLNAMFYAHNTYYSLFSIFSNIWNFRMLTLLNALDKRVLKIFFEYLILKFERKSLKCLLK